MEPWGQEGIQHTKNQSESFAKANISNWPLQETETALRLHNPLLIIKQEQHRRLHGRRNWLKIANLAKTAHYTASASTS